MIETRRIILAAIQSARGTATALNTTSHFLEASGISHPTQDPIVIEDVAYTPLDTPLAPAHVDSVWKGGEDVMAVRLATAAGSALPVGALLQACGLVQTLNATTSAVYKWSSQAPSARKLISLDKYVDGEVYKMMDMCGTAKIRGKVGGALELAFSGQGIANGTTPTAVTFPTSATASSGQGRLIVSKATAITQAGTAIPVTDFEIDLGSDVQEFYDTGSNRGFEVVGWKPTLTITKLASAASSDWAALRNASSVAMIITVGSGRTLILNMPAAVPSSLAPEGKPRIAHKINFTLHDSGSDDALTITGI